MEISGKIIVATEPRTGTSARTGSKWVAQDFVIETHEQYPKRCVFGVFGEDRLREFNINVGDELTVSFDIDAHEYNGRWFNSLRAWRVQRASDAVAADAQANVLQRMPFLLLMLLLLQLHQLLQRCLPHLRLQMTCLSKVKWRCNGF